MTEAIWKTGRLFQDACKSWGQMIPRCSYAHCPGGNSVVNGLLHRGEGFHCNGRTWYCSPDCLESALTESFRQITGKGPADRRAPKPRLPIGQVFVLKGVLTEGELRAGLRKQVDEGGLLGECMERLGLITEDAVTASLASQWSCPIFPKQSIQSGCSALVPFAIERDYELLPVHLVPSTKTLYVAHGRALNHRVLYGIEQMLGYHTEACMMPRRHLMSLIESRERESVSAEVFLDSHLGAQEMARMVRSYTQQLRSESLKFQPCGELLWVAIKGTRQEVALLFRCGEREERASA